MNSGRAEHPSELSVFSGFAHTAAATTALQVLAFATTILLARGLGAELLGEFQFVITLCIFVTLIASAGLDEGLAYLLPRHLVTEPDRARPLIRYALSFAAIVGALLGCAFYFGAGQWEQLLRVKGIGWHLEYLLALLPAFLVLGTALAVLRATGRPEARAVAYSYVTGGLFLAAILIFSVGGLSVGEAYAARILSVTAGAAVALVLVLKSLKASRAALTVSDVLTVHSVGGWLVFIGIFQYVVEQPLVDLVFVGWYDTPVALGLYAVAARVAGAMNITAAALNLVVAPLLARAAAVDDFAALHRRYRAASRWLAGTALLTSLLILILHQPVLSVFGTEYRSAARFVIVLTLGQLGCGLFGLNTPLLIATGFARVEFVLGASACILLVVLAVLLGRMFGAVGVASASAATALSLAAVRRLVVQHMFRTIWLAVPQSRTG